MSKVDWSAKNQNWSNQWGHVIDPKSVTVVVQTREEREQKEIEQFSLPIGPGSHELIREELAKEMQFASRLLKAVREDKLEELDKELEVEDARAKKELEKKLTPKRVDVQIVQAIKDQETRILENLSDEEDSNVESCKKCGNLRYLPGQVGLHNC